MRILVTGGAGYIGSHTVRLLLQQGHSVVVYDNLQTGHRQAVPSGMLVVGDLNDSAMLDQALIQHRVEAVIHFAASAYVGESVQNPAKYYRNNVINTIQLLERMRLNGVQKLVFSSTVATFGVPDSLPITEDHPQAPINPYGRTKLMIEMALADYCQAYGIGHVILRYFNAAGASRDATLGEDHTPETHLIPLVLQTALGMRSHIDIFGTDYPTPDGTCIRDYVHVEDLASAHVLALEHLQPGSQRRYHLGSEHGSSIREIIAISERITGRRIPVREAPRRPGDPPALVASSAKIRRELGWSPEYRDIESILQTAWNWHRTHPRGYAG
ncbi:UDP-glucose 4-epimerase GalE [Tuwongella immobilis]|uniref:UDP-glucose 4-epimerase n=1 Tax=Tuwongella immobilis TaxID=692036 RepID=A0A6C2YR43_9BACT|nr:UDP-glucose 4-epimerase GalE [Tuwongella immobilis]VIP04118.1 udp-glucose 4-epimerase : UDP-glucose 4-epimerase OS=Thermosinus carboxydivorans Nor1 GN=TcarDRAFT_2626 PE=3 SV=1: Epimerase: Epimerase_Csub [Tuwongella immobilis]VTS05602.1 udp-glucose 4-epimerase : UDP-glucose 4-epimerase OS=Thermosinus carboxydivorans Nor1 GN=TcarDRAFT_2626 PE=3 SV=1: Epimerase: Epimerase_Csub [Tuwongella immobilis]